MMSGCSPTPKPATLDTINWLELAPGLPPLHADMILVDAQVVNTRVERAMQAEVDFIYGEVTVGQVVDYLRDVTGTNIVANWPELEIAGIDQHTPVDLSVRDITAEQMLRLMIRQIGAEQFDEDKPGYMIHDGVLVITTRREIDLVTEVWVYDVRDLLYTQPALLQALYAENPTAQPFVDRLSARESFPHPARAFESDGARPDDRDEGPLALSAEDQAEVVDIACRNTTLDTLVWAIEYSLEDLGEWVDPPHKIQEVDGKLVVRTTRANHQAIRALLVQLKQAQAQYFRQQLVLVEVFVLLKRAEGHRLNQNYSAALAAVDQALRVNPQSPEAVAMREVIVAMRRE